MSMVVLKLQSTIGHLDYKAEWPKEGERLNYVTINELLRIKMQTDFTELEMMKE